MANSRLRTTERPMRSVAAFAHATTSTSSAAAIDKRRTGRSSPRNVSSTGRTAALYKSGRYSRVSRATRVASSRAWASVAPSRSRPTS